MDEYLTRNQIAEKLHRQPRWVTDKLFRTGLLKGIRFGGGPWLVAADEFKRFMSDWSRFGSHVLKR